MAKRNQSQSGTNIQKVRQQNQQSAQAQNAGAEFAAEQTNAQQVRQQNQQSQARKGQQQQ